MEESISKFLALEESHSDAHDALRKISGELQGLQLSEGESAVSYIDFIKFKFQRKAESGPKIAAVTGDSVEAEWLHDYMASNASAAVEPPPPPAEADNASDDQAEALTLSPSTFAWRFDDKYLAARRVKVDNFVSAAGDEDVSPRSPPTELSELKAAFSSYLPSGMTLNDDSSDDEPGAEAPCDGMLEDLEEEERTTEERDNDDSETSTRNKFAPFQHVVVDGPSDDCETIEDLDGDTHSDNDDDDAADDGSGRDEDFLAAMIAFLQSSGSKNASLAHALREQQLAARYGLQLPEQGGGDDATPCDDEVHEFSFE